MASQVYENKRISIVCGRRRIPQWLSTCAKGWNQALSPALRARPGNEANVHGTIAVHVKVVFIFHRAILHTISQFRVVMLNCNNTWKVSGHEPLTNILSTAFVYLCWSKFCFVKMHRERETAEDLYTRWSLIAFLPYRSRFSVDS